MKYKIRVSKEFPIPPEDTRKPLGTRDRIKEIMVSKNPRNNNSGNHFLILIIPIPTVKENKQESKMIMTERISRIPTPKLKLK